LSLAPVTMCWLIMWHAPAAAQDPFDVDERYYAFNGCYEVGLEESSAWWVTALEERIYLSMAQLASRPNVEVPAFVVRPAPGYQASPFPQISWLLVGGTAPLQITWEFPLFTWVVATFEVEGIGRPERLSGTVRYFSDELSEEQDRPVGIRLTRVPCLSTES